MCNFFNFLRNNLDFVSQISRLMIFTVLNCIFWKCTPLPPRFLWNAPKYMLHFEVFSRKGPSGYEINDFCQNHPNLISIFKNFIKKVIITTKIALLCYNNGLFLRGRGYWEGRGGVVWHVVSGLVSVEVPEEGVFDEKTAVSLVTREYALFSKLGLMLSVASHRPRLRDKERDNR